MKKNIAKKMIAVLALSTSFVIPTSTPVVEKNIVQQYKEWIGNIIKTTAATYTSIFGAGYYYATIVYPHMIVRTRQNGLGDAILFNVNFALNNPITALYFATPLFASIVSAFIAQDYAKKVWNEEEQDGNE